MSDLIPQHVLIAHWRIFLTIAGLILVLVAVVRWKYWHNERNTFENVHPELVKDPHKIQPYVNHCGWHGGLCMLAALVTLTGLIVLWVYPLIL